MSALLAAPFKAAIRNNRRADASGAIRRDVPDAPPARGESRDKAASVSPEPEALAREQKIAFVVCALLGVDESARWLRDPELTRRVSGALGRALDLLNAARKATETEGARRAG